MQRLAWILGGLAGVLLAAGVTYAASSLSTQRIGISSEPATAGGVFNVGSTDRITIADLARKHDARIVTSDGAKCHEPTE